MFVTYGSGVLTLSHLILQGVFARPLINISGVLLTPTSDLLGTTQFLVPFTALYMPEAERIRTSCYFFIELEQIKRF